MEIFLVVLGLILLVWVLSVLQGQRRLEKYINARGYVALVSVNELEHRYIAMQLLGRDLRNNEVVHHNGKRKSNSI